MKAALILLKWNRTSKEKVDSALNWEHIESLAKLLEEAELATAVEKPEWREWGALIGLY